MEINKTTGLLSDAEYISSPNCDDRPTGSICKLLIIHNISLPPNEFGGPYITQLFTNTLDETADPFFQEIAHLRVSAHLLIRRDGQLIQYVPFHKRAWHAGVSTYEGEETCNNFSVGIELEGADHIPYESIQYEQLAAVTDALLLTYPEMSADRITGHCDVAPNRKTDPGPAFDWDKYRQLIVLTSPVNQVNN
ncbi:MAG: 1,6-anhydro-N-acetylmuramyl-L-alanine amidase AmpD [Gammaproteobacteria bacterium]|nr:1,6-anhydro-N-acetylmuramyl-L-alanine amidase AmpD [Gammaproteobacteria bacterium]